MKATEFVKEAEKSCPPATQDITLNLKNRQKAIDEYGYGPLNPDLPNTKFWQAKVDEWNLDSVDEAKSSLCGNCAAFDQRKDTLACIAQGIGSDAGAEDPTIEAGDLGYCRFLKFKCASRRTCDAWVTGGPLTDDADKVDENLHDWFGKEKWVRMDTKGNIKGDCARGSSSEGKPKCLPQAKAHALGKKGRASAAQKKRRQDPDPERSGKAINVATRVKEQELDEKWSQKYKSSINCSHPKGFSQKAHCAGKRKHNEDITMEMTCPDCGMCETHGDHTRDTIDENCWKGYHKEGNKELFGKTVPNCVKNEAVEEGSDQTRAGLPANFANRIMALDFSQRKIFRDYINSFNKIRQASADLNKMLTGFPKDIIDAYSKLTPEQQQSVSMVLEPGWEEENQLVQKYKNGVVKKQGVTEGHESCPECGGAMYPDTMINEKQDACYFKVKSRYKVWPSAYASGALVQCRKKGAANWGNKSKNESVENNMDELSRILELSTGLSLEARAELVEEFDLIETAINHLAAHNGVDSEVIWEDLEALTDDELYVFAVTQEPIMETEAWQKANNRDRTDGMSKKAVKTYRREHPGSKLQTAVTTKPSKLKKGSKASKRRKSYCSRSRGQMKMHNISCAKTPDKAICKARRRWNC